MSGRFPLMLGLVRLPRRDWRWNWFLSEPRKTLFVSRDCIGRLQWGSQIFFRNSAAEGTCGGPEVGCRVLSWHTPATLATVHQTVDECCQIQGPANCQLEEWSWGWGRSAADEELLCCIKSYCLWVWTADEEVLCCIKSYCLWVWL